MHPVSPACNPLMHSNSLPALCVPHQHTDSCMADRTLAQVTLRCVVQVEAPAWAARHCHVLSSGCCFVPAAKIPVLLGNEVDGSFRGEDHGATHAGLQRETQDADVCPQGCDERASSLAMLWTRAGTDAWDRQPSIGPRRQLWSADGGRHERSLEGKGNGSRNEGTGTSVEQREFLLEGRHGGSWLVAGHSAPLWWRRRWPLGTSLLGSPYLLWEPVSFCCRAYTAHGTIPEG
jgi:hypothetical protein